MNAASEYGHDVFLYLDGELRGQELEDFRVHLARCSVCKSQLEEELELSDLLYRSRPLYIASDELRARVATAQNVFRSSSMASRVCSFFTRILKQHLQFTQLPVPRWGAMVMIALLVAFGMLFTPPIVRHTQAAEYIDTALTTHRSYLKGELPLEIRSASPEVVTAWFADKVSFDFRLPSSGSFPEGQPAYRQVGARLVNYRDSYAALVTYAMKNEQISLLVASSKYATSFGGEEVRSGDLTFHYHKEVGFNIITWTTHGLTYALVSSLHTSARQSCLVCHQNMADEKEFRGHQ